MIRKLLPQSVIAIGITIALSVIILGGVLGWFLYKIAPDPNFLAAAAAFEGVIIAFLIPLTISIIAKLSKRYGSSIITDTFEKNWVRLLPIFLLANIAATILLIAFMHELPTKAWQILALILLLFFLVYGRCLLDFLCFLKKLKESD